MVIYQFIVHRPLLLPVSTTNNHLSQPSHTGRCRTVGHLEMIQTGTHHPVSMAISGTDLLEVPTIYKAYVWEYPHKIWSYMVQYLHFRILKFPLTV